MNNGLKAAYLATMHFCILLCFFKRYILEIIDWHLHSNDTICLYRDITSGRWNEVEQTAVGINLGKNGAQGAPYNKKMSLSNASSTRKLGLKLKTEIKFLLGSDGPIKWPAKRWLKCPEHYISYQTNKEECSGVLQNIQVKQASKQEASKHTSKAIGVAVSDTILSNAFYR